MGANHFNSAFKIIFKSKIVDFFLTVWITIKIIFSNIKIEEDKSTVQKFNNSLYKLKVVIIKIFSKIIV